ncbi:hypothetical protein RI129_002727 [Pyrocoelia pectoralis]|uniref:Helix-turn-helix domain-containing protein n=1 Tax=Pyrocoelia pectoralis TaxID=417401 RepID=A0AAN7VGK6_9COLE
MGNPLSPVIANFYMEKFESIALESAVLKPKIWYLYMTHTDRYLNKLSNHHPCQKIGVIKTLFDRAKKVSDPTHFDEELQHLRRSLQANGYSLLEINKVFSSKPKQLREKLPHLGMVFLPYIGGVTDKIGRILERNNIKTIFIPTKKISEFLRSPKDPLDPLTASGVYKILCSCGLVYIGTTKRSFLTRRKEHMR